MGKNTLMAQEKKHLNNSPEYDKKNYYYKKL